MNTPYNISINNKKERETTQNPILIDDVDRLSYLQCKSSTSFFNITDEEKKVFFNKVRFFQDWAINDQYYFDEIRNELVIKYNKPLTLTPKIYVTFHLGSYRLLNFILHEKKIDFALIVNKKTIDMSKKTFKNIYDKSNKKPKNTFQIIDAESKMGILQMIKAVKKNKSLVFYIDGNTGVGGFSRRDEKLQEISFLNKKILSRKGIGFLSHYLNVPIIPVLSWREKAIKYTTHVKFYEEIKPKGNRENYIMKVTQKLWSLFSDKLLEYPEQWEAWLYVHHFSIPRERKEVSINKRGVYIYNKEYEFFKKDTSYYLYDSIFFKSIKISNNLFKTLNIFKKENLELSWNDISKNFIHEKVLEELINNKILWEK